MAIKQSYIRSMSKIHKLTMDVDKVYFVFNTNNHRSESWERIGFENILQEGASVIPESIGRVTHYNAFGKEIKRKDLPKELRPISYSTTITDWHGYYHDVDISRNVEAYPIDEIPAPEVRLIVIRNEDAIYISSELISLSSDSEEVLHIANMMLECFGEFEILNAETMEVFGAKHKQVHWEVLPAGKYPWEVIRDKIRKNSYINECTKEEKNDVVLRSEFLYKFNPSTIYSGVGGFTGYYVYAFEERNLYILESVYLNNATYVFVDEWEELSKLTKKEIINNDKLYKRIIHNKSWINNIRRLFCK